MNLKHEQSGATLVVSLIMLVVLTLLVVSAIRSGNTNLRIAGNMQVQAEAAAAAQQVIEQVVDADNPDDFTAITAPQTIVVSAGAMSYNVVVAKPTCNNTVPILSTDPSLNPKDEDDRKCIGESSGEIILDASGNPIPNPTTCNQQQWEVRADVVDDKSGAKISQHQGVAKRTYKPTSC